MLVNKLGILSDLHDYTKVATDEADLESQATEETLEDEAQLLPEKDVSWLRDITSRYPKTTFALGALTVFGVGVGIGFWATADNEEESSFLVKKDLTDLATQCGADSAQALWLHAKEKSAAIGNTILSPLSYSFDLCQQAVFNICNSVDYVTLHMRKNWCTDPDGEFFFDNVKAGVFTHSECSLTEDSIPQEVITSLSSSDPNEGSKSALICPIGPGELYSNVTEKLFRIYRCRT